MDTVLDVLVVLLKHTHGGSRPRRLQKSHELLFNGWTRRSRTREKWRWRRMGRALLRAVEWKPYVQWLAHEDVGQWEMFALVYMKMNRIRREHDGLMQ